MINPETEQGLQDILNAIRPDIPPHAMPLLEASIRSYGKCCGHDAVIEHLAKETA